MPSNDATAINPNSALHWLPAAKTATRHAAVSVPETRFVEFDVMQATSMLDGEVPDTFPDVELEAAAEELGYPVFVRSDLASAKHDGLGAVQATDAADLASVVGEVVRASMQAMQYPAALLVREWVDVEAAFTAFDGLPIGTEFRVFATPDDHLCTHYYWPADSITGHADPPGDCWRRHRSDAAATDLPATLRAVAKAAAHEARLDDGESRAWSVDFARDRDGDWHLIDMALAADSWHPSSCEHAAPMEVTDD
jgi:hypothetical protein